MKKRLGDLLCHAGLITEADLKRALEEQKRTGKRMGETLINLRVTTEFDIAKVLATQLGIQYISLDTTPIEPEAVSLIPEALAKKYLCIPINFDRKYLTVAMVDPLDYESIKDIAFHSGLEVKPLISTKKEILDAIDQHYRLDDSVEGILAETPDMLKETSIEIIPTISAAAVTPADYLEKKSQMAPIVKLVNLILLKAIKERSSDIHIESLKTNLSVRLRTDGVLREDMRLPKWVQGALVSRIKILSSLDIAERRLPQDGAIRVKLENRDIDLRISTIPAYLGEKVVIRILDQSAVATDMEELGLSKKELQQIVHLSQKRKGIILVTGPTGSGKTTTLYAIINRLRSSEINVMTVEDPIEYNIEGINQIQVKPEIGLTFANCLRSILRQDPNVILVGEIRDLETAEIAFRAAMTGHLVISTLHTNDAISTITRLIDMGVPRYMIASSVIGIVAQRLVRQICPKCKVKTHVAEDSLKRLNINLASFDKLNFYHGEGCNYCRFTGFYGRTGIFEVLPFRSKIREIISSGGTEEQIRLLAQGQSIPNMGDDGINKVKTGITTIEEMLRVIEVEEDIRILCPQCEKPLHLDFVVCPYCKYEVQASCPSCNKPLQAEWTICPYCKKEL
ncbi:MAG: Flp pilus assembly complex ATPase component TadA [Nitrospirae bacterium]|nr:Flp pilus assembly complex ATPase component TadA [Nitrospirota bacterium]